MEIVIVYAVGPSCPGSAINCSNVTIIVFINSFMDFKTQRTQVNSSELKLVKVDTQKCRSRDVTYPCVNLYIHIVKEALETICRRVSTQYLLQLARFVISWVDSLECAMEAPWYSTYILT